MGLAVARDCVPPSFYLCLPCDVCISGIIRVFFRVLLVGLVFLGRVQQELQKLSGRR